MMTNVSEEIFALIFLAVCISFGILVASLAGIYFNNPEIRTFGYFATGFVAGLLNPTFEKLAKKLVEMSRSRTGE